MSEFKINPSKATVKGNLFKGDLVDPLTITLNNSSVLLDQSLVVDGKTITTFKLSYGV